MFEQPAVNCNSRAKIARCSSELIFTFFLYAGSSIQYAGDQFVQYIHFSFVNFAFHQTPTNKHLTGFGLDRRGREEQCAPHSNSCISVTIRT